MNMCPSQRRGPWSQVEDNYLMQLVHQQGPLNWVRIASQIGSRTPKQCRERYHQNLKPTLNHHPISPEEGEQIELMVQEMGKRWAEIARRLDGRSDNAVKNWWNGSQNRKKRSDRRKNSIGGSSRSSSPQQSAHDFYNDQHHLTQQASYHPYHHHSTSSDYASYHQQPQQHFSRPPALTIPRSLPASMARSSAPPPLTPGLEARPPYGVETPLPSPSALSPGADSVDAPSLVSDHGSVYTTSPREAHSHPASPLDLPPLKHHKYGGYHASQPQRLDSSSRSLPPLVKTEPQSCYYYRIGGPPDDVQLSPMSRPQLPTAPNSPVIKNLPPLRTRSPMEPQLQHPQPQPPAGRGLNVAHLLN